MRILFIPLLLLFPITASAVENSRVELLLQLVRENGCQMDDATAGRILPANDFTREEVSEIEKILDARGLVDKTKMGIFALTAEGCTG